MSGEKIRSYQEIEDGKDTKDAAASLSTAVHTSKSCLKALTPQPHPPPIGNSCLRQSMSHHPGCHLFVKSCSTTVARFCMKRCGAFLSGAIEASISITRGAGGFSISPGLRCARVVPANNPAFELVARFNEIYWSYGCRRMNIAELELSLETGIQDLTRLFRDGKASPYDVNLQGDTLLHVRLTLFAITNH